MAWTLTPAYQSWYDMKRRCRNPRNLMYPRYGGRGITVCGRWMKYANFLADMGERPAGTTLDRINNDGNYEPGNCRWATRTEQMSNTSLNVFVTWKGRRFTLKQLATKLSLKYDTLHDFYNGRYHFPIAEAVARTRRSGIPKTHCVHGHEFTPENTYAKYGRRYCRTCGVINVRNYKERKSLATHEST